MSKAVIYARFSCENQREESIEGQVRECREFAERNNMDVVTIYADRALSAKTDNRPQFQQMIKDSAKRQFEYVIVWKLDRFARNRYDSATYKVKLRQNGVKLISAKEQIADGPEGIILETVLEGMAEYFSADLSQKVIRGMTENAMKCMYSGGSPTVGYSVNNQKYEIDSVIAPIIRMAFEMYAAGKSAREVVDAANAKGFRTFKGKKMDFGVLHRILKNRKYIGIYKWRDIEVEDGIPAIVDRVTFEKVQTRMKKNKHAAAASKAEERYELTAKLFCGNCGYPMVGESCKAHGNVYRYYSCGERKRGHGCKKKPVNKEWIERIVVDTTIYTVLQDSVIRQIAKQAVELQGMENNVLPGMEVQLRDIQKKLDNFVRAIEQGVFNEHTQQRMKELDDAKAELEIAIAQEKIAKPMFTEVQVIEYISQFRDGSIDDPAYRERIIDVFINAVFLFDDKIVFTWNYKDGSRTLRLDDLLEAMPAESECSDSTVLGAPKQKHPLARVFFVLLDAI